MRLARVADVLEWFVIDYLRSTPNDDDSNARRAEWESDRSESPTRVPEDK